MQKNGQLHRETVSEPHRLTGINDCQEEKHSLSLETPPKMICFCIFNRLKITRTNQRKFKGIALENKEGNHLHHQRRRSVNILFTLIIMILLKHCYFCCINPKYKFSASELLSRQLFRTSTVAEHHDPTDGSEAA